jgi:dihydrofolate synthase/folylpolyglutamate synthase
VTEFELTTAMAFKFFSDEKCDIVVLETGMGGKLDATNVIKSVACSAVTSISLDHTEILGDIVEKIAKEKFGIIKPGCPVVLGPCMKKSVYEIADSVAFNLNSPVFKASTKEFKNITYSLADGTSFEYHGLNLTVPLLGKHQINNVATVLEIINVIGKEFQVTEDAVKSGLKKTYIPCRFETASRLPLIILDGAHNPAGASSLANAVQTYLNGKKLIGIFGVFKDKDVDGIVSKTARLFNKILTVEPNSKRALPLSEITKEVKLYNANVLPFENVSDALKFAVSQVDAQSAIFVFGSFSIMKEAKKFIKIAITG